MTNMDKSIDVTPLVLKNNKYIYVINTWRGLQVAYFKFEVFIFCLRHITLGTLFVCFNDPVANNFTHFNYNPQ